MNRRQTASVKIEYLMLADVNDSQADARELVAWLTGLRVHVTLMSYNPIDHAPQLVGSERAARLAFVTTIRDAGFKTTLRDCGFPIQEFQFAFIHQTISFLEDISMPIGRRQICRISGHVRPERFHDF